MDLMWLNLTGTLMKNMFDVYEKWGIIEQGFWNGFRIRSSVGTSKVDVIPLIISYNYLLLTCDVWCMVHSYGPYTIMYGWF